MSAGPLPCLPVPASDGPPLGEGGRDERDHRRRRRRAGGRARARLRPLHRGAVLRRAAGRPGRRRDPHREAARQRGPLPAAGRRGRGRRHVPAVQPRQARPDAEPHEARGPRGRAPAGADGRRRDRQPAARHHRADGPRLRHAARDPARDHPLHGVGAGDAGALGEQGRLRRDRAGDVGQRLPHGPRRRAHEGLGAVRRLQHGDVLGAGHRRGAAGARAGPRRTARGGVAAAHVADGQQLHPDRAAVAAAGPGGQRQPGSDRRPVRHLPDARRLGPDRGLGPAAVRAGGGAARRPLAADGPALRRRPAARRARRDRSAR